MAGAIKRAAGGRAFQDESDAYVKKYGKIPVGGSCYTSAGIMENCKYVIHTVGPVYKDPKHSEILLHSAILNTLEIAKHLKIRSLSIPAISSGIFGFPKPRCAEIILSTCINWLALNTKEDVHLRQIRLCNFDRPTVREFEKELIRAYGNNN